MQSRRFLATIFACAALHALAAPDIAGVERIVVEGTNAFRADEGRSPVKRNRHLDAAAEAFAKYMADTGKYGHEVDGSTPAARATAKGYEYCIVSENIAYRYDSRGFNTLDLGEEFLEGWKQSPGHRKNMVEPWVTDTAIAVAESPKGVFYAVQMFGRPKALAIRFKVRNESHAVVQYRIGGQAFSVSPGAIRTHSECREDPLTLEGARPENARITPRDGDDFVVTGERGRISLKRE